MSPADKLIILFLAANPRATDQLKLDEEVRSIDNALRLAEHRDRFDLRSHWALRYGDLSELLLRYRPHVVHFSGHGSATGEIVFSDERGEPHMAPPAMLTRLFNVLRDNIRCVVLNACYSDQQAKGIARSIDCVVGMRRAVADDAAVRFAADFYKALGFGRSVATAFELGSIAMGAFVPGEEKTPHLLDPRKVAATLVLAGAPAQPAAQPAAQPQMSASSTEPAASSAAGGGAQSPLVVPPLRELKGKQLLAAMNALLAAYSTEAELALMVKAGLHENLAAIAGGSNLQDKVFNLLEWARMRGRLSELLQAAYDARRESSDMRDFVAGLSSAL